MRSPLLAGALTVAAALACATPAAAESIVYLRDWNVWLANPDGTGQYQVTTDGREALPYLSPSQADDGTIAVAQYDKIKLLRQNGTVIREFNPPPLRNTYSHQVSGSAKYVAISPDGTRIAYSFISFEDAKAQATTGFVAADGTPLPGNLYNGFPSWVTNTRSLTSGGFGAHVNIHDQGQETEARWLNDNVGELTDPEVNRQGTFIGLIRRAYNPDTATNETSIVSYQIIGNVLTGTPDPVPQARCIIGPEPTLSDPSWSPNGQALVWGEAGNLWTIDRADTCAGQPRQLLAGGSAPDWGPAPVNPGPRDAAAGGEKNAGAAAAETERGRQKKSAGESAEAGREHAEEPREARRRRVEGLLPLRRRLHRVGDRDGRPRRRPHTALAQGRGARPRRAQTGEGRDGDGRRAAVGDGAQTARAASQNHAARARRRQSGRREGQGVRHARRAQTLSARGRRRAARGSRAARALPPNAIRTPVPADARRRCQATAAGTARGTGAPRRSRARPTGDARARRSRG